jgi:hypothetical protein
VTGNPFNITVASSPPRYWARRQRWASTRSVISIVCMLDQAARYAKGSAKTSRAPMANCLYSWQPLKGGISHRHFKSANVSNIDHRLGNRDEDAGSITDPLWHPPVTESSALPPDLRVECNDQLPSRNPAARNSETPLPKVPSSHEAGSHLAGAYRIRTSHVRLLQMRSRRKGRYSVGPDEVRRYWLAGG